jgi:hypothetical protein
MLSFVWGLPGRSTTQLLKDARGTATASHSTRQLWKKAADALHIVTLLISEALD